MFFRGYFSVRQLRLDALRTTARSHRRLASVVASEDTRAPEAKHFGLWPGGPRPRLPHLGRRGPRRPPDDALLPRHCWNGSYPASDPVNPMRRPIRLEVAREATPRSLSTTGSFPLRTPVRRKFLMLRNLRNGVAAQLSRADSARRAQPWAPISRHKRSASRICSRKAVSSPWSRAR